MIDLLKSKALVFIRKTDNGPYLLRLRWQMSWRALRSWSCFIANQRLGREMVLVNLRTKRSENFGAEVISSIFYHSLSCGTLGGTINGTMYLCKVLLIKNWRNKHSTTEFVKYIKNPDINFNILQLLTDNQNYSLSGKFVRMTYNNTLTCRKDCRKYKSIFLRKLDFEETQSHVCFLLYRVAFLTLFPVFNSIASIGVHYFARNAPSCSISIFRSTPSTLSRFSSQQRSADRYAPLHKEIRAAISLGPFISLFISSRESVSACSIEPRQRRWLIPPTAPGTVIVHVLSCTPYRPVVNEFN